MHTRTFAAIVLAAAAAVAVCAQSPKPTAAAALAADPRGKELDDLLARGLRSIAQLSSDEVQRALELGAELERPHAVAPLAKMYLARESSPPAKLLNLAAENARMTGDYRTAVTRQKQHTRLLPPRTPEASESAGKVYGMLMDMGAREEAYVFMKEFGEPLRGSVQAKKHDQWFLQVAWEREDFASFARWLAACMGDQAPLEQERFLYWNFLNKLVEATRRDNPKVYEALPDIRRIPAMIRESPPLRAQLQFQGDYQLFCAGAKGRDKATLVREFAPVAAAAKAWFDAVPTAGTLAAICAMWSNGAEGNGWQQQWERAADAKCAFFKEAFMRLSDAEKAAFFREPNAGQYANIGTSPETWLEIIKQSPPGPGRNGWSGARGLPWKLNDPAPYRAAAPVIDGIVGVEAAIMRSLAAGDDFFACLENLAKKESWFFDRLEDLDGARNSIENVYRQFPRDDSNKLPEGAVEQATARYAREVYFLSPMPVMEGGWNRAFMTHLWHHSDRAKMVETLHLLDWVPLSGAERQQVYDDVEKLHRAWGDWVRRERDQAARKSKEDAAKFDPQVALIEPIAQALKEVQNPAAYDVGKAPSVLCQHMARFRDAANRKNRDAAIEAGRAAYAMLRDYEGNKLPLGRMCLYELLRPRRDVELFDLRAEVFGDQLDLYVRTGRRAGLDLARSMITWSKNWQGLYRAEGADRMKLEAATSKATLAMLGAGKFDPVVFDLHRETRMDNATSRDIMTKLIESKVLLGQPEYRLDGRCNAATTYQWLLEREFQWMNEKYPRDRYFDDMYAEEVKKTRKADAQFWQRSADTQRKGANAVAGVLKGFAKLPLGYDGSTPVYGWDEFWSLCWNVVGRADDGPRQEMLTAAQAAFGTTRFDDYAMGGVALRFAVVPESVESRKRFFAQLAALLDRARSQPRVVGLPDITGALNVLGKAQKDLTDADLALLKRAFLDLRVGEWDRDLTSAAIGLFHDAYISRKRAGELLPLVPILWGAARGMRDGNNRNDLYRQLTARGTAAADAGLLELAATHSTAALSLGEHIPEELRRTAETIRAKALVALGGVIPVDRGDRRYPVYAAQLAYLVGQYDAAWDGYVGARTLMLSEIKNLDPLFVVWIIEQATSRGEYGEADKLAAAMIETVENAVVQMSDNESRARLFLAQADIALARQDYPLAKSMYERIGLNKDYEGTRSRSLAEVKVADVERLTKDFSGAIRRLESLLQRDDPFLLSRANYLLALIKYDQEEYGESRDYLTQSMQLDPTFTEARILDGKLNLKLQKLVEATRVKVGLPEDQRVLIPGRPLSFQVEDRNLSVVGTSMGIELRVWTSSGDEEIFSLMPFGDSKTRFDGQLPTILGGAEKQDRVLQVLGGDEVRYDYSERFKTMNKVVSVVAPPVTVMSDPEMYASSGVILSREEMAEMELERQIRSRVQMEQEGTAAAVALSTMRQTDQIKPGNPVRVRVVDPDRSTTAGKDRVSLRAVTTSGDSVQSFELEETADFSGIFDGELKTGVAPATAFASDNNEGSDAAFAVSSGDYPPWVGLTDGKRPKFFGVDLNDNVAVKNLSVLADVPARGIKRLLVQTSLNGRQFDSVGAWPDPISPWDGALRMKLMRFPIVGALGKQQDVLGQVREFAEMGGAYGAPAPLVQPGALSVNLGSHVMGQADTLGVTMDGNSPDSWYLMHLRGGFYLPKRAERTFRANVRGPEGRTFNVLVVDGKAAVRSAKTDATLLTQSFGKGVHVLDLYLWAQRGVETAYAIEWDIKEPPYFAPCPAELFDITKYPQISVALKFTPATITPKDENKGLDIAFPENSQARVIRLGLLDFEGDAPAISKLTLTDVGGRTVLPTKEDLLALRKNDVLETMPGDKITITYEDPTPVTKEKRIQEAMLAATFYNAGLNACFLEVKDDGRGGRQTLYVPMRRFRMGDAINVFINDPDCDVSDKADVVKFTATATSGATTTLDALETEGGGGRNAGHTGVFIGRIFPVEGEPQRPAELQLAPGDDVEITYRDAENTDYGIPWDRIRLVEQAGTDGPELRMFDAASSLLPSKQWIEDPPSNAAARAQALLKPNHWLGAEMLDEFLPVKHVIGAMRRDSPDDASTSTGVVVCPVLVEVTWPAVALSPLSHVRLYAQTTSSRELAGVTNSDAFDPTMGGTVVFETGPSSASGMSVPPGYQAAVVLKSEAASAAIMGDALDEGLFTFSIPMQLGEPLTLTPAEAAERRKVAALAQTGNSKGSADNLHGGVPDGVLAVRPNDEIVIGFEYPYGSNDTRWVVRHVQLTGDAMLDVMDRRYQEPIHAIFMGEKVYVRVVDPMADTTNEKDVKVVQVRAGEAGTTPLMVMETFPHSGVFKCVLQVVSAEEGAATNAPGTIGANYGDTVVLSYSGGIPGTTVTRSFRVSMGADGLIQSFTKRFKDPSIAVQTQFTVAESYFELAKNHRDLKQEELARREIAQGRKLLHEAIRDFPQSDARAQAEYLLAELSLELAQDTKDEAAKKRYSADALQRFIEICASYPDSAYAPKAQFKKAMTLEKMGQIDEACEEYVRLSYKFPGNELVAETIARLGQYFLTKGKAIEAELAAASDLVKKERLRMQSVDMFKTAAQVFGRLSKRFPDHQLAAKTMVLSGQCYMRAADYERAVVALKEVIDAKRENDLTAEAMYWCGDCYIKMAKLKPGAVVDAYRMFKKLTWDYPESQWAKYARGRLTEPALAKADSVGG